MTVTRVVGGWMFHSAGAQMNMRNRNFGGASSQRLSTGIWGGASGNEIVRNPQESYGLHE